MSKQKTFWPELQALKLKHERLAMEKKHLQELYVGYKNENKKLRKQVRELEQELDTLKKVSQGVNDMRNGRIVDGPNLDLLDFQYDFDDEFFDDLVDSYSDDFSEDNFTIDELEDQFIDDYQQEETWEDSEEYYFYEV